MGGVYKVDVAQKKSTNTSQAESLSADRKSKCNRIILSLVLAPLFLLAFSSLSMAATYYISGSGNDTAGGLSVTTAWKTIAKANASLKPGDTVYLLAGTYADQIRPAVSGSGNAGRITYSAYDGQQVILSNSVTVNLRDRSYISIIGFTAKGGQRFLVTGESTIQGNAHHNIIKNNTISNFAGWGAIYFSNNCTYNEIIGNTISYCHGDAILLSINCSYNTVRNNVVHDTNEHSELCIRGANSDYPTGQSNHNLIKDNIFYNSGGTTDCAVMIILNSNYNIFEGNKIYETPSALGNGKYAGLKINNSSGNILRYNHFSNLDGFGTLIYANVWGGLAFATERNAIHNNVFHNCEVTKQQTDEGAIVLYRYANSKPVNNNVIINNIISESKYFAFDVAAVGGSAYAANNLFANNTLYNNSKSIRRHGANFTATQAMAAYPGEFKSLNEWDPQYLDSAIRNFTLKSTSPCIDAGTVHTGLQIDFSGVRPDIGANEHAASAIGTTRSFYFSWNYTDSSRNAGGFQIYSNGSLLCGTTDSAARQLTCTSEFASSDYAFTIAAVDAGGQETPITETPAYKEITAPLAIVSSSTAAGNAPLTVNFDGSASTTPNAPLVSYSWNFGDGSKGTGAKVSHVFTTAGTYTTELTVQDSKGLTGKISTPIVVAQPAASNKAPLAAIFAVPSPDGNPLIFSFDGSQSSDPDGSIVSYAWSFGDGTTGTGVTAQHTYASAGTYTVSLKVTDDDGATATATKAVSCGAGIPFEVGELALNNNWVRVLFNRSFSNPIVIAGPSTTVNEAEPVTVRIRNIDREGFDIRLQEWDHQNGTHAQETVNYMIMEKGVYTLGDGSKLEAGSFTGSSAYQKITLQQAYPGIPVVLPQVVTENEDDAVNCRMRSFSKSSFYFKLQEMELTSTAHIPETVNYIAWQPGKGEVSGFRYEVANTAPSVTDKWYGLTFGSKFSEPPAFFAGIQTDGASDTVAVRGQKLAAAGIQISAEEEQSKDLETTHSKETVGFLSIGVGATVQ